MPAEQSVSSARPVCPWVENNRGLLAVIALALAVWQLFPLPNIPQAIEDSQALIADVAPVITDVKVNGLDGPVALGWGESYTYSWSSINADVCDVVSPFPSAVVLSGASEVDPGEAFYYPTASTPVTLSFTCQKNGLTSSDSVTILFEQRPPRLLFATLAQLPAIGQWLGTWRGVTL